MRSFALSAFLLALAGACLVPAPRAAAESSGAAAYAISDNTTGFILSESNAHKKLQIGSLTKIATAMVVLDWAEAQHKDLNELATVPDSAQGLESAENGVGFHPGDRCSLRDLLYAALMQSDNTAAQTLAAHVGASLESQGEPVVAFVAQMNALARKLGMRDTRFLNAHGLDSLERTLPYSTAADLSILTRYAIQHPSFVFYVSQKERRISIVSPSNEPSAYMLQNTNELLGQDNIDGVKTGTTRHAGPCVIVSAARAPESRKEGEQVIVTPRRLNVVVLGAPDRFALAKSLLERGWTMYDAWAQAGRPLKGWKAPR